MSSDRDTTRVVRSWLEEGVTSLPDRVLDDVLDRVPSTPQRRATWWPARRLSTMNNAMRFGLAAAVVALAAFLGFNYLVAPNVGGQGLGDPTPTPSPSSTPSPSPTPGWPSGTLEAGRYRVTDRDGFVASFELPDGWSSSAEGTVVAGTFPEDRFRWILFFQRFTAVASERCSMSTTPVGPSVDDLANAIATIPGTVVSEPVDATVGGLPAKMVEFTLEPDIPCELSEFWLFGNASAYPGAPNATLREWIFELNGTRYVIHTEQVGSDPDIGDEITRIIESIEFETP